MNLGAPGPSSAAAEGPGIEAIRKGKPDEARNGSGKRDPRDRDWVAIVASFFVQNFYAAKGMYGELSDKQIPTRMGRLFFCVVGGMFILIGIMFFFPNQ